ncbi:ead/Ea22-like family protein, partial [Escherichia coli]|nr:ead/Ea22-like family protein [Escherichia coli]
MSEINYQELREAAAQAMHDDWGFDVDLFHEMVTPSIVLALLDERERNQQYIKRRDQENEEIALTVGKLRVELEAAENNLIDSECHVAELEEALRDKQALLEASEKRNAKLQSENAYIRNRYKELDLLIGKNILV